MTNADYTHISLVADRSGSMSSIADEMNGGLEAFVKEQGALPGTLKFDVTTFDSTVERPFKGVSATQLSEAFPLIRPRGLTALNDAIGLTITSLGQRLASMPEEQRPGKVIVMIVTDGLENASKEYTSDQIKKMVETQRSEFAWEFMFLGANIDSFDVAGNLGILRESTINYAATSTGATSVLRSAMNYVATSRAGGPAEFTDEDREATMI